MKIIFFFKKGKNLRLDSQPTKRVTFYNLFLGFYYDNILNYSWLFLNEVSFLFALPYVIANHRLGFS